MPKNKQKDSDPSEEKKVEKKKDQYIYAKITDETRSKIDALKEEGKTISYIIQSAIDIYTIYHSSPREIKEFVFAHEDEFGGQKELVMEAIQQFIAKLDRSKASDEVLWERTRLEMNVMIVGKKFITQLINAADIKGFTLKKPQIRNLAIDPILWYSGKPIKELDLEEFLNIIKKIWVVFKYFNLIDIKKQDENEYYVMFNHRQNKSYSNFWLKIFKELFKLEEFSFQCTVDGEAYEETLSLTIKGV
jgi:hypothetical protein